METIDLTEDEDKERSYVDTLATSVAALRHEPPLRALSPTPS